MRSLKTIRFVLLILLLGGSAGRLCCQSKYWQPLANGVGYWPWCFLADSGGDHLWIGGNMANPVDSTQELIMTWDGGAFSNLAPARYNPGVVVSIVRYGGEIVVAGTFDSIGGVAAQNIARWDGSSWKAFSNDSPDNGIFKLFLHKGKLYAGGIFFQAGAAYSPGIMAWDGNKWEAVAGGLPPLSSHNAPRVYAMAVYKGQLFAGGNAFNMGGSGETDLAIMVEDHWEVPAGWQNGYYTTIKKMLVFQDELYIGGVFSEYRSGMGNGIVKWDGRRWQSLGPGLHRGAWVEEMLVYKNELYVVGPFDSAGGIPASQVAKWDGHRWCNFGVSDFFGIVADIAVWNDELYIAGTFTTIDGDTMNRLAKWTGITTDTSCGPIIFAYPDTTTLPESGLVIYPNPATDYLSILDDILPDADHDIRIFDLRGKLLLEEKFVGQDAKIDISKLAAGIYCIEVKNSTSGNPKVIKFEVVR